jgi:hypothetical protein
LLTLGTLSSSKSVYAVGKGKGLYVIDPANVNATPLATPSFNAVGHLVISEETASAFASANTLQTTPTEIYNQVSRLNLNNVNGPQVIYTPSVSGATLSGQDDIALATEPNTQTKLYVVVNPPPGLSTKHVAVFGLDKPGPPAKVVDLKESTNIRVAYNQVTKHTMLTYEDSYRIGLLDPNDGLLTDFRHPVQISPLSIAVSSDRRRVFVLNFASNTINSIPAELLHPKNQIPLKPLVDYRADVINAFADLLGGLIQYLKDCFCDHFLVNCPTCDEDDKLYLACITIKDGQVFKVCNFSLRRYVHSFPTVEYWLSVIPIIPLIKKAVETFCCTALPGFFSKFSAFKPQTTEGEVQITNNTLKSAQIQQGVTFAQQTDFRGATTRAMTTAAPGGQLLTDLFTNKAKQALVTQPSAIQHADVTDKPADEARQKLEDSKIIVETVQPYDPNKAGRNLIRFAEAPPQLEAGMRVNLVTKDDKVLFYTLADEPSAPVAELRDQVEAARATAAENKDALDQALPVIAGLRSDVIANQATVAESKAALEKISPQVEALRARVEADASANKAVLDQISPQLQNLQLKVDADSALLAANKATIEQALPQLTTLSAAIEANRAALDQSSPQIADLRARVDATAAAVAENKAAIADAAGLRDQVNSLSVQLVSVQQTHAQELAAREKDIADLKLTLSTSQQAIGVLNERMKKLPPIG